MGNFLRVILNEPAGKAENIFVDFDNVEPTEPEQRVWSIVKKALDSAQDVLQDLQCYKGATEDICLAISNPNDEDMQVKAWQSVLPLVVKLKKFFDFSLKIERIIPELLGDLCSDDRTPREHMQQQQALFKQFSQILDFVLMFDEHKMTTPAVQNDFSYYRRTISKRKQSSSEEPGEEVDQLNLEMANQMSLFYAQATPMLKALSDVTAKFVTQNKELPVEQTTDCLSMMAKICRTMIENTEFRSRMKEETQLFCMRVMTGVIILYDHVHPVGAFARTATIETKSCIKVLKEQPQGQVESLLNALRYTTIHVQDEATPRYFKNMLAN